MKNANCPRENEVAKSARSNEWNDSLRTHVEGCEICRDVATAAGWMQNLARREETDLDPRQASLIWWKAQLAERQARSQRAQEIAAWIEIVFGALLVAGIAGWVTAGWQSLQEAAAWVWASIAAQASPGGIFGIGAGSAALWTIVAAASILVVFVAYPIFAED
jgi:hypothetical protein